MRTNRKPFFGAMLLFMATCIAPSLAWGAKPPKEAPPQIKDPEIQVRLAKQVWTYTHKQLLEMATTTIPNLRGTRKKPFKCVPMGQQTGLDQGPKPLDHPLSVILRTVTGDEAGVGGGPVWEPPPNLVGLQDSPVHTASRHAKVHSIMKLLAFSAPRITPMMK